LLDKTYIVYFLLVNLRNKPETELNYTNYVIFIQLLRVHLIVHRPRKKKLEKRNTCQFHLIVQNLQILISKFLAKFHFLSDSKNQRFSDKIPKFQVDRQNPKVLRLV